MAKLEFIGGNQLQLLHNGEQFFATLLAAIDNASTSVSLETYIFADDACAQLVKEALCRAASRGLQVHVMIDWIGCGKDVSLALQEQFSIAKVDCRIFNPWFKRGLTRTHRKLCVVDQRIAFVGGINIIDDYLSDDGSNTALAFPRWDFAIKIEGGLVALIDKEITAQWLKLGKLPFLKRLRLARSLRQIIPRQELMSSLAALVVRDNLRNRTTIQKAYLKALGTAQEYAIIANPYFAPGRRMRNGLISAAKRGIDVSLLLGVGEFHWQDAVAQSYYPQLLAHGIKIYEYRKTKLHAKVAVIDQAWATIGSSNFDGFSLFINQEANVLVRDVQFSKELTLHLKQGIADAVQIDEHDYRKQTWWRKTLNRSAFHVYRGMMHLLTFGKF
jgi:cardiolipin synthase